MKKILIHREVITKVGAKLQFQIKLPVTAVQVTGIIVTAIRMTEAQRVALLPPVENEDPPQQVPPPAIPEIERGWLWLRIPEKRDVFYADTVRFAEHICRTFQGQDPIGLASQNEWWFSGKKRGFFRVTIPVEDSLIEGFYQDVSPEGEINYTLQIYLELEKEDNNCHDRRNSDRIC